MLSPIEIVSTASRTKFLRIWPSYCQVASTFSVYQPDNITPKPNTRPSAAPRQHAQTVSKVELIIKNLVAKGALDTVTIRSHCRTGHILPLHGSRTIGRTERILTEPRGL